MSGNPSQKPAREKRQMSQQAVIMSRIVGVAAIVIAFVVYGKFDVGNYSLVITVTGIIALVAPDVVDKLPIGPFKPPK